MFQKSPTCIGTNESSRNSYSPAKELKRQPGGKRIDYILYKKSSKFNVSENHAMLYFCIMFNVMLARQFVYHSLCMLCFLISLKFSYLTVFISIVNQHLKVRYSVSLPLV